MSHTVFFSWQSDRRTREGRNFIEKALQMAVARIAGDLQVEEAVRDGLKVDKDTTGVPGSPPIFQTILSKIDRASVFLADLTFCGARSGGRPTPNPNVLIEYGWALKALGHFQVLSVMNEAHGEPNAESLPFDLAQLRFPIRYNLPDDAPEATREKQREQLAKELETALKGVFDSQEFKEKLPKAPEPPLFKPRVPMNGKARFRAKGQPLGVTRDSFAHLVGSPTTIPVFLAEGAALWMRLMPLYGPGRGWLTQDLKPLMLGLCGLPLMGSTSGFGFLEGEDGCGYYTVWGEEKTYSVAYAFKTGELWIINALHARTDKYIQLDEQSFTGTLAACAAFLDRLGCAKPYRWVVGMEGVQDRQLVIPNRWQYPYGNCLAHLIDEEGAYKEGNKADEVLRPFFQKVFDQCGARRPEP
jgi:hypothetical protein